MKNNLTEHVQSIWESFEETYPNWTLTVKHPYQDTWVIQEHEIKSHLLQSQLKTIELAKNELQRLMRDTLFDDCGICLPCINNLPCADKIKIHHENYGRSTAITLLDTIIQEVKVQI